VTEQSAAELIGRYVQSSVDDDFPTMDALRHPEWQETWPQSGEIVTSSADYQALRVGRPEGGPSVRMIRVGGSGACWWSEVEVTYADGSRWLGVSVYELVDNLVHRERVYFGQPFPAPAWRAQYVTQGPAAIS
jgi:hypothetical protein